MKLKDDFINNKVAGYVYCKPNMYKGALKYSCPSDKIGGFFRTKYKLIKLAEQIDNKDRQFIPKLGDNGFYF